MEDDEDFQEPFDLNSSSDDDAEPREATEVASAEGAGACCPSGHALVRGVISAALECDGCAAPLRVGDLAFSCARCDHDRCANCAQHHDGTAVAAAAAAVATSHTSTSEVEPPTRLPSSGSTGTDAEAEGREEEEDDGDEEDNDDNDEDGGDAADGGGTSAGTEPAYKMCGVNGCILKEKHGGTCMFPFIDKSSRERKRTRQVVPTPGIIPTYPQQKKRRMPTSSRPGPKPKPKPKPPAATPAAASATAAPAEMPLVGHVEDDIYEVGPPLD